MTAAPGTVLHRLLEAVAWRITFYRLSRLLGRGVLAGGLGATALLVVARFVHLPHASAAGALLLAAGALWGIGEALRKRSSPTEAAILADRRSGQHELFATACDADKASPLARALLRRADACAAPLRATRIASFPCPWELVALLLLAAAAFALAALVPPRRPPERPPRTLQALMDSEAREVLRTAGEIETRFPGVEAEVSMKLRQIASRLENGSENYTETRTAVAALAQDSSRDAETLVDAETALAEVLEASGRGSVAPETLASAERKLHRLAGGNTAGAGGAAEEGLQALGGLQGGDSPRFHENARALTRQLEKIRAARLALETAALRLQATREKLESAPGTGGRGVDEPGNEAPRRTPPRRTDRAPFLRRRVEEAAWDPAFDEVVRRYFAPLEEE